MPRERLESDGGEIAKNRYKPVHPRVHQTYVTKNTQYGASSGHSLAYTMPSHRTCLKNR